MSAVVLLHHNATPYTSVHTIKEITNFAMTVLPHPLYSPDLTPEIITCLVLKKKVAFSTANKKLVFSNKLILNL
jgi:hypothetical protein